MNPDELQRFAIFAQTLKDLQQAILPGMTLLRPVLLAMMGFFVLMELITTAAGIMWLRHSVPAGVLRIVLRTSVLVATLQAAPWIATNLVDGFTQLGLLGGNNTITVAQFMDPGAWLSLGFQTGKPLLNALAKVAYWDIVIGVMYLGAWLVMVLAFLYMGFSLFVLQFQMSLSMVGAQVLLSCAASRWTSWLARGAIAYPANMAFRFFFKAFISSLLFTVLRQRAEAQAVLTATGTLPQQFEGVIVMLIIPVAFAIIFIKSDSIAGGLLQGVPGLSTGNVLQAAAGGIAMATGMGGMAMGGMRMAASAGSLALRTTAATQTAFAMGSATTVGGQLAQMAGGMRGVAIAAGRGAGGMVSSMTSPGMAALRQTVQAGRQAGFVASGGTLPSGRQGSRQTPTIARPGPTFTNQLRQTLQSGAYYFGNDHGHGGASPHF